MNCNVTLDIASTLHHENIYSHPQYNLASPCSAILLSSKIAMSSLSKIAMSSLLHHKNVFLNPQYNLTSLCIKAMQK